MRYCILRSLVVLGSILRALAGLQALAGDEEQEMPPRVGPVPAELRESLKLDPFYAKHTDYKGYPILASGKVSDSALLEARYLISQMLADRDDILQALIKKRCRFTVMAPSIA